MIFDMLNELDNAYSESENNVLDAITESCTKALSILDNIRDDCDIGCFGVFQEAVAVKEKTDVKQPKTKTGDGGKKTNNDKTSSGNKEDKNVVVIHPAVAAAKARADKTKEMNIALNKQLDNEFAKLDKLYKVLSNKDFKALCRMADNSSKMFKAIAQSFDNFIKTKAKTSKPKVTQEVFLHDSKEKTFYKQFDADDMKAGAVMEEIKTALDNMTRPHNTSSKLMFSALAEAICEKYYYEKKTNADGKVVSEEFDIKGIEELKTRLAVISDDLVKRMYKARAELMKNIEEAGKNGGIIKKPDNYNRDVAAGTIGASKIDELSENLQAIESDLKILADKNSGFVAGGFAKARRLSFETDLDNYNRHWFSTQVKAQRGNVLDKVVDTGSATLIWFYEFIENICKALKDLYVSIKESDDAITKKHTITAIKTVLKLLWKGITTSVKTICGNPFGQLFAPAVSGYLSRSLGLDSAIIISCLTSVVLAAPIKAILGIAFSGVRRWMAKKHLVIDKAVYKFVSEQYNDDWEVK